MISKINNLQSLIIYASEADVLNMAVFGYTAKQWRDSNKNSVENIRDYTTFQQYNCFGNTLIKKVF